MSCKLCKLDVKYNIYSGFHDGMCLALAYKVYGMCSGRGCNLILRIQ